VRKIDQRGRLLVATLFSLLLLPAVPLNAASPDPVAEQMMRVELPGHVLPTLSNATQLPTDSATLLEHSEAPLTLTVVLRRSDQAGFERYLGEVYDPRAASRNFLSQGQIAARFGPSQQSYDAVLAWLQAQGFTLVQGSANRLTVTVSGTRPQAERAFSLAIHDYELGNRRFYANDRDPALPADIARDVQAITGLSNAAIPGSPLGQVTPAELEFCEYVGDSEQALASELVALSFFPGTYTWGSLELSFLADALWLQRLSVAMGAFAVAAPAVGAPALGLGTVIGVTNLYCFSIQWGLNTNFPFPLKLRSLSVGPTAAAPSTNQQRIGLLEFDTFRPSDIQDWLNLGHGDPSFASRLSAVPVNGGVNSPGAGESEVLLDIVTSMITDPSPNTSYVVYHAPANTSFQQLFNVMINDGVTVISNSWTECEDQHTLAEVQSIDSVLAQAAASGISVFNGSGDGGSTCLDGSPNTIGVPADSPNATAVGGTTPSFGPGYTYRGEKWWNGSGEIPPTGQGGFGVSRFFARPAYQNGLNASAMRSVPDVAVIADPRAGLGLCQADAGGCPTGLLHGGTSMATPAMAGMVALLNETVGSNIGQVNPVLYPLAGTKAFHSAASMGSDFAHVGLGSPHANYLRLALSHQTIGPVSASASAVVGSGTTPADGVTAALVQVNLTDANGYPVSGKTVTLTPSAANSAIVSVPSGPSDVNNGAVVFTITDLTAESISFTATDTTDGVVLQQTPTITFGVPPASSAGIIASPTTVASDGTSTTTITVTLKDALNRPTPGKLINLSQASGHSIITGPSPAVTDANGQIQFTATDNVSETVTYTAVDVSDANLPVPGSASVTFTGGATSCIPTPPTAANGFTLTPFANGFVARNFFFGNINFVGCPGAANPAFSASGDVFVADFPTGDLYKFGANGGAVSNANKLANLGPTFGNLVYGLDGSLYATQFSPSKIEQIDPATGAVLRTVASGFTCPGGLAVDPLSGDLFFDDACTGGGADNPSVWRIHNPSSPGSTVTVYATLPATPGGAIAFAPNGTLYVVAAALNNSNMPIVKIGGTNTPSPPTTTTLSGITSDEGSLTIGAVQPSGEAKSLLVHTAGSLELIDITTNPFTTTTLATGTINAGVIGPDGCLYTNAHDSILKLTPNSGGCGFNPTNPSPTLVLTPSTVSPNPAQGSSQTFTATFKNTVVPAGTPVTFEIAGTNPRVRLGDTDANGVASVTYAGVFIGTDTIVATATVGNLTLTSNLASVTWVASKHVTFLTLNLSPATGATGQSITLSASLVDVSQDPHVAIAGLNITFSIGNQTCLATTNGQGIAACAIVIPSSAPLTLSASFGGNAQFTPASDSELFRAVAAAVGTPPGAPTIGTATAGDGNVIVSFTAPASNGGSPITGYTVTCTPVGGGAAVTATGTGSPITVSGLVNGTAYTCTVSAANAAGTGPASGASNVVTPAGVTAVSTPIPTLSELALIILAALLGLFAVGAIRRRD
jgi:hypothetical protein